MSALAKSHASWFLVQYDIWKYFFFLIKFPVMCIIIFTRICEIYWQHRPRCAGYIQRRMEKQTQKICRLPDILVDHIAKCCRTSPSPNGSRCYLFGCVLQFIKLKPFTVTKSALVILYTNSVLNWHLQKSLSINYPTTPILDSIQSHKEMTLYAMLLGIQSRIHCGHDE